MEQMTLTQLGWALVESALAKAQAHGMTREELATVIGHNGTRLSPMLTDWHRQGHVNVVPHPKSGVHYRPRRYCLPVYGGVPFKESGPLVKHVTPAPAPQTAPQFSPHVSVAITIHYGAGKQLAVTLAEANEIHKQLSALPLQFGARATRECAHVWMPGDQGCRHCGAPAPAPAPRQGAVTFPVKPQSEEPQR